MDNMTSTLTRLREIRRDTLLAQVRRLEAAVEAAHATLREKEAVAARVQSAKAAAIARFASQTMQAAHNARDLAELGVDVTLFDGKIDAARAEVAPAADQLRDEEARLETIRANLRQADARCEQVRRAGKRLARMASTRAEAREEARTEEVALQRAAARRAATGDTERG